MGPCFDDKRPIQPKLLVTESPSELSGRANPETQALLAASVADLVTLCRALEERKALHVVIQTKALEFFGWFECTDTTGSKHTRPFSPAATT